MSDAVRVTKRGILLAHGTFPARGVSLARGVFLALGLTAAILVHPAWLRAQQPPPGPSEKVQEPAMAPTPKQFRISATVGALLWGTEAKRPGIDDGAVGGLDIERRVGRYIAFRVGGAYGRTTLTGDTAAVSVNQYLFDLMVEPRFAFGPLRRTGVVPFATVGLGVVVHDPEGNELVTKSQSAAAFGGGFDVDLSSRFGGRAEWRHYIVDTENIFDPTDRTGVTRTADRVFASLYWKM